MYLIIYIHRIVDSSVIQKKFGLICKNRVRSLDELAQTDTIVTDDFFFVERPFKIEDFVYSINPEAPLSNNINLIIRLIDEAPLLK